MNATKEHRITLRKVSKAQKNRLKQLVAKHRSSMNTEILNAIDYYLLHFNPTPKQEKDNKVMIDEFAKTGKI